MRPGFDHVDLQDCEDGHVLKMVWRDGYRVLRLAKDRARVAAWRLQIHNPLLEDINLRGARTVVLVHITAKRGSLACLKFTEVGGAIIEEVMPSEDATVRVGCAIESYVVGE